MKSLLKITTFFTFIFALACGQKSEKTEAKNVAVPPISKPEIFSVFDSLNAYVEKDSFEIRFDSLDAVLFLGKANGQKFGVWAVADSSLCFYHLVENQWVRTDSIEYKLYANFLEIVDLNGDNFNDIKVSCISGSAGNLDNRVFMFDPHSKTFKHNIHFDLINIEYDSVCDFVKSSWWAGVVHCQEKWKYKISGDSLVFEKGVTYCPDEQKHGETGTLELYKEDDNQRVVIKSQKGDADKLFEIFEKTLWDSSDRF